MQKKKRFFTRPSKKQLKKTSLIPGQTLLVSTTLDVQGVFFPSPTTQLTRKNRQMFLYEIMMLNDIRWLIDITVQIFQATREQINFWIQWERLFMTSKLLIGVSCIYEQCLHSEFQFCIIILGFEKLDKESEIIRFFF